MFYSMYSIKNHSNLLIKPPYQNKEGFFWGPFSEKKKSCRSPTTGEEPSFENTANSRTERPPAEACFQDTVALKKDNKDTRDLYTVRKTEEEMKGRKGKAVGKMIMSGGAPRGSFNSATASGSSVPLLIPTPPRQGFLRIPNSHSAVPRLAPGRDKIHIEVSVFCCADVCVLEKS